MSTARLSGAVLAFTIFARLRHLPVLLLADVLAPAMVLGLALGRIGCLFNGCCYGGEAPTFPLAIRFPRYTCPEQEVFSPPYLHQLAAGRLHGFRVGGDGAAPQVVAVDPGSRAAAAGLQKRLGNPRDQREAGVDFGGCPAPARRGSSGDLGDHFGRATIPLDDRHFALMQSARAPDADLRLP